MFGFCFRVCSNLKGIRVNLVSSGVRVPGAVEIA